MNHFLDIILLAILAFFIGFKLFTMLGQKRETLQEVSLDSMRKEQGNKDTKLSEKILNQELSNEEKLKLLDESFSEKSFIKNAEAALKMIFDAYGKGDTAVLSELLAMDMMRLFAYNLSQIEEKKYSAEISVVKLSNTKITNIDIVNNDATIYVSSKAEFIEHLKDKNKTIAGHKNKVESKDLVCEFTRNIKSKDPTWKLLKINYIPFEKVL